ncbi:MAG: UbiD family decarboxylase [Chloroflexi bacterium]|nr:UbiD family decarboxylase [Chloroflexota bacterium]
MAVSDLHTYLAELEREHPGEVVHVHRQIDHAYEVTAIVSQLDRENRHPVLVFHNINTPSGAKSKIPVVTNLFGSRRRTALALGSTLEKVGSDYYRRASQPREPVVLTDRREAPVKQVIQKGNEVDLYEMPALVHHDTDPGPYFTAAYITSYDIDTGIDNSAMQRGWMRTRNEIRVSLNPHCHNMLNLRKHERLNKDMKVAYWSGHHPAALLGAQTRFAYPWSHYGSAGGLLSEPLRLVPSETLGDDFLVPADAEVVVEGIMKAHRRVAEGPFGEYTGYVGPQTANPLFEVTAITRREDAYWHDIAVGYTDIQSMMALAAEGALADSLKRRIPSFRNVCVPASGVTFHAYVQLANPQPGEARDAIMCAVEAQPGLKHVFVVDEDVNVFNEKEVLWAIATRSQWDRDAMVFTGLRGIRLDPSAGEHTTTKAGLDCTKPFDGPFPTRCKIPEEVGQRIQLTDYIAAETLASIPTERE